MSDEYIYNGKEIIIKFLGYNIPSDEGLETSSDKEYIMSAHFDTSLELIFPVIDKIRKEYDIKIEIIYDQDIIVNFYYDDVKRTYTDKNIVFALFNGCVEFIIWYNKLIYYLKDKTIEEINAM